ncbi:MAG: hypothetical protein JWM82_2468, partial [Myxococcales bacterium]|nr:hypothetical protein [Myxococcales bacterium]
MNLSRALIGFVVLAGGATARPAFAAEAVARAPLLVVVEAGPGAGCDAEAVREAIANELGASVVAPMARPLVALASPRVDTLLVALDRERIVLTLRGRGDRDLTRSVAVPAERAARLRMVAWLAGNLVRDQLASLALPEASPSGPSASDVPRPDTSPVPAPKTSSTAPQAFAASAVAPTVVVRAQPIAPSSDSPRWTFSLVGGPALMFGEPRFPSPGGYVPSGVPSWNVAAALEVHRHFGAWFVGGALDSSPGSGHPLGVAALGGARAQTGRFGWEASGGAGLEAFGSRSDFVDGRDVSGIVTRAYARAALAMTCSFSESLDVISQLGGHLTA